MNSKQLLFLKLLVLVSLGLLSSTQAQVITTITSTGSPGSFITGSVNAAGSKNDGLMVGITATNNRGWAVFDLSSIPTGSVINSVNIVFTTTSNAVTSSVPNFIGGYTLTSATDPAIMTGSALYTQLATTAANAFNNTTWAANTSNTKLFNTAGVNFISTSLGGQVVISFVRGSTNNYEIYGYDAPTPAQAPQLVIDYLPSTACSGTPTGGSANASNTNVCPSTSFTLSLSGATAASGLTYQWYEAVAGSGSFSPIPGATSASYSVANLTGNTDYQATVTCTNSGSTATSTPVTVNLNSFVNCYCASGATTTADEEILNVTFGSLTNASTCTSTGGPGSIQNRYSDYTTLVPAPQVVQGSLVPFSVEVGTCGNNFNNWTKIYIDYNQNGLFTDPGEEAYSNTAAANGPNTQTGNILIPITATVGVTRMRVVTVETNTAAGVSPCGTFNWGETEDYLVEIQQATPCSGLPVAGTIGASVSSVCVGQPIVLTATGYTIASGVTFEWQENNGSGFTAIPGATNPFYTVASQSVQTDYQLVVTCTNPGGGASISNVITVVQNTFLSCYCTSAATSTTNDDDIWDVEIGGMINATTCVGAGVGNTYSDFSTSVAPGQIMQGNAEPFTVVIGSCGTSSTQIFKIFVDYNQNGLFTDPGETAYTSTATVTNNSTGATVNGVITVPLTAIPGITKMRVVSVATTNAATVTPCGTYFNGETEDYNVEIMAAPVCVGAPTAGTAAATVSGVCVGQTFTLSVTGYSVGNGITFQWESAPAGSGSFTPIANATDPTFVVTGQTVSTDYQVVVSCTNPGGGTATSNIATVSQNSFLSCYCSPLTGTTLHSATNNYMVSATISGTTFNVATGLGLTATGYSQVPPTPANNTADMVQGVSYTFTGQLGTAGTPNAGGVWVDWNQDGVFSTAEYTALTIAAPTVSATISVPLTATPGQTGLRVRLRAAAVPGTDACITMGSGETEDYVINVVQAVACTGTPNPGVISSTLSSVCVGQPFTISALGYSIGLGITFQWESAPAGSGTFTAIPNATNFSYAVTSQTAATDYRLVVTCTNPGGGNATSNVLSIGQNTFLSCYCASNATSPANDDIWNVTLAGMNNSSTCAGVGVGNSYTDFSTTVTPPQITQGNNEAFSVTVGNCGTAGTSQVFKIFVDYNQNGLFTDPGETAYTSSAFTSNNSTGNTVNGTFTVPLSAVAGITKMRVVTVGTTVATGVNPCGTYVNGETEDYNVEVLAASLCAGTPVAGTPSASLASVCAGQPFTLSVTGYTVGTGITFQWQSSPAGAGTFTAIANATDPTYVVASQSSATDYQVVVTCTNPGGGSATSAIVPVAQNSFVNCYCTSSATTTADEEILNVTFGSLNNSSTCTSTGGPGSTQNQYSDYTAVVPAVSVMQGSSVPLSVQVGTCGGNFNNWTKVFIDYNQNGLFTDPGEEVYSNTAAANGPNTQTGNVIIPITATVGVTRMRVINMETGVAANVNPCGTYNWGETEDYLVDITAAVGCTGTPSAGTISTPVTSVCTGQSFTLSSAGYTVASGITFQWEANTGSGFAPITGATSISYTVTGQTVQTTYQLVATCTTPGGGTSTSNTVTVGQNTVSSCYCSPLNGTTLHNATNDYMVSAIIAGTTFNVATGLSLTATGYSQVAPTPANNTADLAQGASYPFTGTLGAATPTAAAIWIDWNQDGVFSTTEYTALTVAAPSVTATIVVPVTALLGQTGMRVRLRGAAVPATDACITMGSGETEDYVVNIISNPTNIVLGNISATNIGQRNRIDWTSLSEDAGDRYEMQRSANGRDFTVLGVLNGKGKASVYAYFDEQPVSGVNYYRLRLLHSNGAATYSQIVQATVKANNGFDVVAYPNPVTGNELTVEVKGDMAERAIILMTDVTGRVVRQMTATQAVSKIDMTGLGAGVYLIKYQDATHQQTIKITK